MADFNKVIPIILKHEGGYVNNSADPGGATNMGIILKLFRQWAFKFHLEPTEGGLKAMTKEQASVIYKEYFWDRIMGDGITSQPVAALLMDSIVNLDELKLASGRRDSTAVKFVQTAVGVTADGLFGQKTLKALNDADPKSVFESLKNSRIGYYNDLVERKPALKEFHKGWLKRVNSFKYA